MMDSSLQKERDKCHKHLLRRRPQGRGFLYPNATEQSRATF